MKLSPWGERISPLREAIPATHRSDAESKAVELIRYLDNALLTPTRIAGLRKLFWEIVGKGRTINSEISLGGIEDIQGLLKEFAPCSYELCEGGKVTLLEEGTVETKVDCGECAGWGVEPMTGAKL